jgi:hypothetical protein
VLKHFVPCRIPADISADFLWWIRGQTAKLLAWTATRFGTEILPR